nr:MAG TPA: hypothetical protein [Caudoviricetes sp.]
MRRTGIHPNAFLDASADMNTLPCFPASLLPCFLSYFCLSTLGILSIRSNALFN